MKKSILKIVLPAFALLLAIGIAFATEESNSVMTAYYENPLTGEAEETTTDCPDSGQFLCKQGPYQLYSDIGLTQKIKRPTP